MASNRWNDSNATLTASAAACMVPLLVVYFVNERRKSRDSKPLPPSAPVSRLACIQAFGSEQLTDHLLEWASALDFAPAFCMPLQPFQTIVAVTDPDLTKQIFMDATTSKPFIYKNLALLTGMTMFNELDHIKWKHARKGVAPAFSSNHISRMNKICQDHVDRWIQERLEPMIDRDEAFDPGAEFLRLTVSLICESAFETVPTREEIDKIIMDQEITVKETHKCFMNPLRIYFHSFLSESHRAIAGVHNLMDFARVLLRKHRANPEPTPGTVIDLINKNPHYPDDEARLREMLLFIAAGSDTTTYTVAWILLLLAEHPQEQVKLQEALSELHPSKRITCPELQRVIKEGMRLHPVAASGSARLLGRDFMVDGGRTVIPKGSVAFLSQILTNRNPKVYNQPDMFIPDRWKEPPKNVSAFAPFSLGPRNCVGQGLATAELNSVLAKLCGDYTFELVQPCRPTYFISYKPKEGLIKAKRMKKKKY